MEVMEVVYCDRTVLKASINILNSKKGLENLQCSVCAFQASVWWTLLVFCKILQCQQSILVQFFWKLFYVQFCNFLLSLYLSHSCSPPPIPSWAALIKTSLLSRLCLPSLGCSLFYRYDPTPRRQTQTAACSVHLTTVWTTATLQPYQKSLWHTTLANKLITLVSYWFWSQLQTIIATGSWTAFSSSNALRVWVGHSHTSASYSWWSFCKSSETIRLIPPTSGSNGGGFTFRNFTARWPMMTYSKIRPHGFASQLKP